MVFTYKFFKSLLVAAVATLLGVPTISATLDIGGLNVEETLTIYNNTLLLNGAGMLSNGKTPLYVAQIYAKQKFQTLDELFALPGPKRFVLTAIHEVDTGPIIKLFNRNVDARADKNDRAKLIPGLMSIGNIFRTHSVLHRGDVMTFDWIPIFGMAIYWNGKLQGSQYREPELFRAIMGVWMGDIPANATLKDALLRRI